MKRGPRRTSRGAGGVAAVGVLAIGASLAGAGPAAGAQAVDVELPYTCELPGGEQPADATIAATFPDTGSVGKSIEARDVAVAVDLPVKSLLAGSDTTGGAVSGSASLATRVVYNGDHRDVPWSSLTVPETPVPQGESLSLVASGDVPSITLDKPGTLAVLAGDLSFDITVEGGTGAGAAGTELMISCTLRDDEYRQLTKVPVRERGSSTRPGGTSHNPSSVSKGKVETGEQNDGARSTSGLPPGTPESCVKFSPENMIDRHGCAYMNGYSDISKLHGAIRFENPGLMNNVDYSNPPDDPTIQTDDCGVLHIVGYIESKFVDPIPPARATFLTFGFMPTTATTELTQVGPARARFDITNNFLGKPCHPPGSSDAITISTKMSIRVHDVSVNGASLDVGPDCTTVKPMRVTLHGSSPTTVPSKMGPDDYTLATGGALFGTAEIPSFSGCGVNEDLDALMTSTISGPGNAIEMTQGILCTPLDSVPKGCPPVKPEPHR